MLIAE